MKLVIFATLGWSLLSTCSVLRKHNCLDKESMSYYRHLRMELLLTYLLPACYYSSHFAAKSLSHIIIDLLIYQREHNK